MTGDARAIEAGAIGSAVLLAERGELTCARVVGREGSRFVLENLIGERFAVATPRLFWSGRTPVDDLARYWDEVRALAKNVALEAAWQALEAKAATTDANAVAQAALGSRAPIAEDAVALAVFGDTTFFRVRERVLVRESAAEVAATQKKRAEKDAAKAKLERAVHVFKGRLAGITEPPCDAVAEYRAALIDVAAKGRESEAWAFAQPLCEALGSSCESAFDLLVRLGELARDANLAPYRAGLPLTFDAEALAEAERLAATKPNPGVDMTQLEVVAIDDADTTEVDDAVALQGQRVWVFISDAAAWVQAGSVLDRVAAERTATVYLPEGKLPMLPPVLGEGPLSLLAEGTRQTLGFSFEIAADGHLTGFEVRRATVRIARRLTYDESDAILAAPASDPVGPLLSKLQVLMDRHRGWRNARGAVAFQRPEVYFDVLPDSGGRVKLKIGDPLAPARQLVQELMIAACTGTAVFCAENQIACVYRAQAAPDVQPKVAGLVNPGTGRIEDATQQYELLRRLKPSVVQTEPAPHWTLGVPAYTQVTSPIRRYADLLMHQQLSTYVRTGRPLFTATKLQAHLFELGRRASLVRRVEQESRRYYALRYLEQNVDQVLTGTVLRELGKKTLLELQPLALQELVLLKKRRPPGSVIRFEVIAADARKDEVQLKELP